MRRKIVACLDIKEGRVVKGINFEGLRDMGDPVDLAKYYDAQGVDELVFLDISRTENKHALMLDIIKKVSQEIKVPLTVGGGIHSLDEVSAILEAGATKVSISSAAVSKPDLINEIADKFGSDKLTIAIDTAYDEALSDYYIYTRGGKQREDIKLLDWAKEAESRGAGSLLVTSIQHDGVKEGFDIQGLSKLAQELAIPIIASGGAGSIDHFVELFSKTQVESGLAASIFHQGTVSIPELKNHLNEEGIEVYD